MSLRPSKLAGLITACLMWLPRVGCWFLGHEDVYELQQLAPWQTRCRCLRCWRVTRGWQ